MKIRLSFISNSSSTSFLIIGEEPNFKFNKIELPYECKKMIREEGFDIQLDKIVYLTEFISDWYPQGEDGLNEKNFIEYHDGGHGGPYDEEYYIQLTDGIWLHKGKHKIKEEQNED